jgi:hypothetical protein
VREAPDLRSHFMRTSIHVDSPTGACALLATSPRSRCVPQIVVVAPAAWAGSRVYTCPAVRAAANDLRPAPPPTVMLVQQKLKCSSQRLLQRTALSQQGSDATGGGRSRHCEGASPRACTAATAPANCPGPAVQAGPPRSCHMSPWALQNVRSDNALSGSGDRTFTTTTM